MAEENVFDIERRIGQVYKIAGQPTPAPQFGENATEYQRRLLCVAQHLLPAGHVWRRIDIRQQPDRALASIEDQLVTDRVAAFKKPEGPLRSITERDRTGREILHWYGDPEHCWGPFKAVTRRLSRINTEMGTGENSPQARAAAAAARHEMGLAYQALDEKRFAAGIRE